MVTIPKLECAAINSGTGVKLLHGNFSYSWQNLVEAKPSNGQFGNVEVQQSGWENPMINMTFHIPVDGNPSSNYMTWALWNQFAKQLYDGTVSTVIYLSIYSGNSSVSLRSYADSTGTSGVFPIPVVIKSYSMTFSPNDSSDAGFWTINAQLQETQ